MLTLPEVKAEVERLAAEIGAAGYVLPTYGRSEDGARPHIEVDSRGYHYVAVERGQELERLTTDDLGELLSKVFAGVTFSLASEDELEHRVEGQDPRRILFRRQVGLLSELYPCWGEREAQRHEQILREYPFDDNAALRAQLAKGYREQGYSPEGAYKMACERYPEPKG